MNIFVAIMETVLLLMGTFMICENSLRFHKTIGVGLILFSQLMMYAYLVSLS